MDQNQPVPPPTQSVAVPPTVGQLPVQAKPDQTSSIVTILLLIIAYPVGVLVMWLWPKWNKIVKALVTVPLIISIIFGGVVIKYILNSPELKSSMGVFGAASQCMKLTDKKAQETCLTVKIADATVEAACKSNKMKPKDCDVARAGIKEFAKCTETKSAEECKTIMEKTLKQGSDAVQNESVQDGGTETSN
ncbi:MAG: hypothetical protein WCO78_02105 [Candidatus Roizmanbacteria bacterium]